jgi:hypothetical protein
MWGRNLHRLKHTILHCTYFVIYRLLVLSHKYCSFPVDSLIVLMESSHPAAETRGGIVTGSDERLSDKIRTL